MTLLQITWTVLVTDLCVTHPFPPALLLSWLVWMHLFRWNPGLNLTCSDSRRRQRNPRRGGDKHFLNQTNSTSPLQTQLGLRFLFLPRKWIFTWSCWFFRPFDLASWQYGHALGFCFPLGRKHTHFETNLTHGWDPSVPACHPSSLLPPHLPLSFTSLQEDFDEDLPCKNLGDTFLEALVTCRPGHPHKDFCFFNQTSPGPCVCSLPTLLQVERDTAAALREILWLTTSTLYPCLSGERWFSILIASCTTHFVRSQPPVSSSPHCICFLMCV